MTIGTRSPIFIVLLDTPWFSSAPYTFPVFPMHSTLLLILLLLPSFGEGLVRVRVAFFVVLLDINQLSHRRAACVCAALLWWASNQTGCLVAGICASGEESAGVSHVVRPLLRDLLRLNGDRMNPVAVELVSDAICNDHVVFTR